MGSATRGAGVAEGSVAAGTGAEGTGGGGGGGLWGEAWGMEHAALRSSRRGKPRGTIGAGHSAGCGRRLGRTGVESERRSSRRRSAKQQARHAATKFEAEGVPHRGHDEGLPKIPRSRGGRVGQGFDPNGKDLADDHVTPSKEGNPRQHDVEQEVREGVGEEGNSCQALALARIPEGDEGNLDEEGGTQGAEDAAYHGGCAIPNVGEVMANGLCQRKRG